MIKTFWKRVLIGIAWAVSFVVALLLGKARKQAKANPIVGHRESLSAKENKAEYKKAVEVIAEDIATMKAEEVKRKFFNEFGGKG